jgi:type III restriction enzyme
LPSGISLWMDFSATPKDQSGSYFPWIICDYPLAQAVEDRIVKAPLIVHRVRHEDPKKVTRENALESYEDWLRAALARWREHYDTYQSYGVKPVLFIMAENNGIADEIGRGLVEAQENGLHEGEVLVIHTDDEGEITKKDLERARDAAKNIDDPESPIKVIVSVLMLREGWDVRNVSVVLGLRPFTSKAKILPEQAIGRGLRLMSGIGPDRTQTLEVMGTQAFEDFVRDLEIEGLGIKTVTDGLKPSVKIEPIDGKRDFDINIPLTMLRYTHNYKRISDLDPSSLKPISDQEELGKDIAIRFIIKDLTTESPIHVFEPKGPLPLSQALLSLITKKVMGHARLAEGFAEIYPLVREYVTNLCFGQKIDLESENARLHLREPKLQDVIARYLARKIGELVAEARPIEFDRKDFRLSDVEPFPWRRNLPLIACGKTIFNLVATYNDFEKSFAQFLEGCDDIIRFSSLGTTEQESGTQFKVDYIKLTGAIGLYYPDWVAVQKTDQGDVNWIIETKGRIWDGTQFKDDAIKDWCRNVSEQTSIRWRYIRVNQADFETLEVSSFEELLRQIGIEHGVLGQAP